MGKLGKALKIFFTRIFWIVFLLLLQAGFLVFAIWGISGIYKRLQILLWLLSLGVVIWIISRQDNPSVKLPWVILILLLPVFGGLFYLMFGTGKSSKRMKQKLKALQAKTVEYMPENDKILEKLQTRDASAAIQSYYLQNECFMPVYQNTRTQYLPLGEIAFKRIVQELEKAKKYIFVEFFIISKGIMWNEILEILKRKAALGLDVRVLYDDAGCLGTLPRNYPKQLEEIGIKCQVFNPMHPSLNVLLNNRDHRKLVMVDGHAAFTGGINLADEYINVIERHGHWKDSAIYLEGDAAWTFTLMFLENWNACRIYDEDYNVFRPEMRSITDISEEGYVQPYYDSPLDDELVGESVYINMINHAHRYLYITTPYLVADNEVITALRLAAKNGIDVRIITPKIFDHWYVHMVTQAYYPQLISAGVKIYEYTPGFIHAKTFIADDKFATVGSVNLDYRSLYHHYECGVWMYRSQAVEEVRDDFLKILPVCNQVTEETCQAVPWYIRCIRSILRIFAPLM